MKYIHALFDKPKPDLITTAVATLFVSGLLAAGLLCSVPLWVLWVFYGMAGVNIICESYKLSKEDQ
jgi:hypothetical protein